MPMLPKDFEWAEFLQQDDSFWEGLRLSLVNFLAFGLDNRPHQHGSGFIIGVIDGGYLLVLTAKHVLEGAIPLQDRKNYRPANATPLLFSDPLPDIHPDRIMVMWGGRNVADMLSIKYANFSPDLDIAVCILQSQEHLRDDLKSLVRVVALNLKLPEVGQEIQVVALSSLKADRVTDEGQGLGVFSFENRVAVRCGRVASIEASSMGHRATSFRTSIPTPGGMSGGFAYIHTHGGAIAACGIVSHSDSRDDSAHDFRVSGQSTIVDILGALALQIPRFLSDNAPKRLIAEAVHAGEFPEISGLAKHLRWSSAEDGAISVSLSHRR